MMRRSGLSGRNASARPMGDINVVPLVDVMLVLLVVFIVTAPLLTHAVKLELPRAASHPDVSRTDRVEIAVRQDGGLFWNGEALTGEELAQRAAALAAAAPATEIHLKGDARVPYGDMARALSALARSGLTRIGFVTQPE